MNENHSSFVFKHAPVILAGLIVEYQGVLDEKALKSYAKTAVEAAEALACELERQFDCEIVSR